MPEPLLTIFNRHTAACGDPPIIDNRSGESYIGYFENSGGDQWIFTHDRKSGKAFLRGGDVEWNTEYQVVDGLVDGLILAKVEKIWLYACWSAATDGV